MVWYALQWRAAWYEGCIAGLSYPVTEFRHNRAWKQPNLFQLTANVAAGRVEVIRAYFRFVGRGSFSIQVYRNPDSE